MNDETLTTRMVDEIICQKKQIEELKLQLLYLQACENCRYGDYDTYWEEGKCVNPEKLLSADNNSRFVIDCEFWTMNVGFDEWKENLR
ncbi:MAG: hypothetical protein DRP09_15860 [Candidatus Thorarchaeota archaeon]|nr:MAG: hypothetical protein DRP09_15860 [Candidatus Thorarchaeota archaeon]